MIFKISFWCSPVSSLSCARSRRISFRKLFGKGAKGSWEISFKFSSVNFSSVSSSFKAPMIVSEATAMSPSSLQGKKPDMTKIIFLKLDRRDLESMRATKYLISRHSAEHFSRFRGGGLIGRGFKCFLLFSFGFSFASFLFLLSSGADGSEEPRGETASSSFWPEKVKVGGEFRLRVESQINYDFNSGAPDNDTFLLLRTRAYIDINPNENLRFFGMFQGSETVDQESALIKTPDRRQFYQGFVVIQDPAALGFRAKIGRQELSYGDQRLIGNNNWNNLGRSFDG